MLRTIPTRSSTRRCLVMACRVSVDPLVSCEMEQGCPSMSFATKASRVSSPSAANTSAWVFCLVDLLLRRLCDIFLDVLHLLGPAALVPSERFEAAVAGEFVKAGLRNHKQRTCRSL